MKRLATNVGAHLTLLVLVAACASSPSPLDELSTLIAGTFDSHANASTLPREERFVDKRIRINAPAVGTHVFYQQLNKSEPLDLYRQRVFILSLAPDGRTIVQKSYPLLAPERYVDADATDFLALTPDALGESMASGCEQEWQRSDEGFRGYVDPTTCTVVSTRTGKIRSIEGENRLSRDFLALVERGYDAESGEQLFGTPQGQSLRLDRVR